MQHLKYLETHAKEGNPNFQATQYGGLGLLAVSLQEIQAWPQYFNTAASGIQNDIEGNVYKDGCSSEQTAHYHRVATRDVDGFVSNARRASVQSPPALASLAESMVNYLAMSLDPQVRVMRRVCLLIGSGILAPQW